MISNCDDNYQPAPHGSNLSKQLLHALTLHASQFCDTLYEWCTEMATGLFGTLDYWPADLFLHKIILKDIIIFIDTNKIVTLQDLQKKTNWYLCEQYSSQIISLIQCFFSPGPPSNLFILTPLPP